MNLREHFLKHHYKLLTADENYRENILSQVEQIIPQKHTISQEQELMLKHIVDTLSMLDDRLSVFKKYGITYQLSLVGGAIRDFVLNKTDLIHDFDIALHFPQLQNNIHSNSVNYFSFDELAANNVRFQQLWNIFFPDMMLEKITDESLSLLTQHIIQQQYHAQLFVNKEGIVAQYKNEHITGIIKINDMQLAKPVDLIINSNSNENLVMTFSFDLCKGFVHWNDKIKNDIKENGIQSLLSYIVLQIPMVHDIVNKEMTMHLRYMSVEHIEYYMKKHYLKMCAKFPDFTLNYRLGLPQDLLDNQTDEEKAHYLLLIQTAKAHQYNQLLAQKSYLANPKI